MQQRHDDFTDLKGAVLKHSNIRVLLAENQVFNLNSYLEKSGQRMDIRQYLTEIRGKILHLWWLAVGEKTGANT